MFEFRTLWKLSKHENPKISNTFITTSCALIWNIILSFSYITTFTNTFLSNNKSALSQIPMHWFKILYLCEILNNILNLTCFPNNKKERISFLAKVSGGSTVPNWKVWNKNKNINDNSLSIFFFYFSYPRIHICWEKLQ